MTGGCGLERVWFGMWWFVLWRFGFVFGVAAVTQVFGLGWFLFWRLVLWFGSSGMWRLVFLVVWFGLWVGTLHKGVLVVLVFCLAFGLGFVLFEMMTLRQ